jgi:hypothetical protein
MCYTKQVYKSKQSEKTQQTEAGDAIGYNANVRSI